MNATEPLVSGSKANNLAIFKLCSYFFVMNMSSNLFRVGLEHFLGLASVLWCCGFLLGCAGQPQKDMYFRMRPPTSEVPFFHKNNSIGFSTQTESRRFTIHPTNNLLTKFNFDNNEIYANEKGIPGFDLAFVYTKYLGQFPFELYVSTDFVKLKFQIFDARSEGSGLLLSGNLGQAKTAFFQSTSACGFLCFDNAASEKNRTIEDGIKVSGEGTERKIGMSLGYYFNEKWGSFISYNRFDILRAPKLKQTHSSRRPATTKKATQRSQTESHGPTS
jgi:hypothetical protein